MIRLQVTPPGQPAREVRPRQEAVVVGRGLDCDLVIDDVFLSRQHACIYHEDDRWWVTDLGSRNGTRLNGEVITEPRTLSDGDLVRLSGSAILVELDRETDGVEAADDGEGEKEGAGDEDDGDSSASGTTVFRSARALLAESTGLADEWESDGTEAGDALHRWAERLRLVNAVHRQLGRSLTLDELLNGLLDQVFDHLQPERGAVYLRRERGEGEGDGEEGVEAAYRVAAQRSLGDDGEPLQSRRLLQEVAEKGLAALVLDARTDERFSEAHSLLDVGVRSMVAAPLLDGEESLGMIALDSRLRVRQFEPDDMELLVALAAAAALRIRNLWLTEEAAERRRMQAELSLARRIQVALLPPRLPELEGWSLHGGNLPSRGVSGDFYEVVPRGGGEAFLVLADVSGKGMAASLLTASLEALLAPLIDQGLAPDDVAGRTGRLLHARTPPEKYATAVLAVLTAGSGRVRYAGAGHNPSLVLRAGGEVEVVDNTGPPLGLLPEAAYGAVVLELAAGDTLLAYTDGLVEATDPDGEEYGLERLRRACARHRDAAPADLARELEADVERFARGVPCGDDRTLLVARRTGA